MKKITRNSCFETNSSSTHAISVDSGAGLLDTLELDSHGNFSFSPSYEFGWDRETYNDPISKLNYLYIYARDWSGGNSEYFMRNLKEAISEHTGAERVFFNDPKVKSSWSEYSYQRGYIDHQSVECRELDPLMGDKKLIKKFLFSPNSYVETKNDNSDWEEDEIVGLVIV